MIKSMTGFGRANIVENGLDITVEIKAVNHRYFEFSCRMPRAYQFIEDSLKALCQKSIQRGKIEMSVFIEDNSEHTLESEINRPYLKAYLEAAKTISKEFKIKNQIRITSLLSNPEIFKIKHAHLPDEANAELVLACANEAIENFVAMRETEGERLKADVLSRTDFILEKVAFIEKRSPETLKAYRERLEQKMRDLLGDAQIDESRLITETAIFADKIAVAEETVRLRSHISQLHEFLESDSSIGKKLDFIVQEMNRETNTIGSKAQDIEIAHTVVDIKSEIEKIREQIQNIE